MSSITKLEKLGSCGAATHEGLDKLPREGHTTKFIILILNTTKLCREMEYNKT